MRASDALLAGCSAAVLAVGLAAATPAVPAGAAQAGPSGVDAACERLAALALPGTAIASAQVVAAGAFVPPAGPGRAGGAAGGANPYADLPSFCRVTGTVARQGDTDVKVEFWLPRQGWNGEFRPAASGFTGGTIGYGGMAQMLRAGWATGNTNRGHDGGGPWKVADMASLPYHLMVATGKRIVAAYYGRGPALTLMDECGGGGSRDALQLVQDFPEDLDAAVAVGFVYDSTHHGIGQWWVYQATHRDEASYIPPSKYPVIHRAALDACDAKDGVRDGVIEDPPRCKYDLSVLQCKAGDGPDCLTPAQIEAVRTIYSPAVHARTGRYLFAPMPPGGELGWEHMAGPTPYPYVPGFYRNMVFRDQSWDYRTHPANFDTHVDLAEAPENKPIDATKGDLRAFAARGGKLLLIGGWNDHTLAPGSFVDYYESVLRETGPAARDAVRLFMVPGMDHCFGQDYKPVHEFDAVGAVRQWKATGRAPESIVVTRYAEDGRVERRRLVCAYPRVSQYNGAGAIEDPANYTCRMP